MNMDKLYRVDAPTVSRSVLLATKAMGYKRPETCVMAAAAQLISVCERYDLPVRLVLDAADRVMRDAFDKDPVQGRAYKRLLREELPNE